MRFCLPALLLLLLTGCYSNPGDDYLDTVPKTNNSAFLPSSGGEGQGAPQMPPMPGMGGMGD